MTTTTLTDQLTGTWTIDTAHSRLGFSARHAGIATVRGSFTGFEGQLVLDGANPAASSRDRDRAGRELRPPATSSATSTSAALTSSTSRATRP